MRLVRFNRHAESPTLARLGLVLADDRVVDLRAAYARYLVEVAKDPQGREIAALRMPPSISAFLQLEQTGRTALRPLVKWVESLADTAEAGRGLADEPLFAKLADCRMHAPVRLTKLIVTVPNAVPGPVPRLVMKPYTAVVGPTRDIVCPNGISTLHFSAGIAAVIGTKCRDVPETDCLDIIAGYTVMTDVSVLDPDIGRDAFAARMFESFSPSGPWLMTADEIGDVAACRIRGFVNGELWQEYRLGGGSATVARTLSFASRMGFDPGDVVWMGDAAATRPLRIGDLVETTVDGLGTIRNRII